MTRRVVGPLVVLLGLWLLVGCTISRETYTRASDGSLVRMPTPPLVVGMEPVTCWQVRWRVDPVFFGTRDGGPRP